MSAAARSTRSEAWGAAREVTSGSAVSASAASNTGAGTVVGAAAGAAVGATAGAGAGAIRPSTAQRQVRGSGDPLAQAAGHRGRLGCLGPSRGAAHCQAPYATALSAPAFASASASASADADADASAPATVTPDANPSATPSAAASAPASLPQLEHAVGYRGAVVTPSAAASAAACPGWRAHPLAQSLRRGSYIIPLAALVG